jgi:hypothetical protein
MAQRLKELQKTAIENKLRENGAEVSESSAWRPKNPVTPIGF